MDKKEALVERNAISKLLGTEEADANFERNIFLLQALSKQDAVINALHALSARVKEAHNEFAILSHIKQELHVFLESIERYRESFKKDLTVSVNNFPHPLKEVTISNTEDFKQDFPSSIQVSNLREIKPEKFPEEVRVTKPEWYREFDFKKLCALLKDTGAQFLKQAKTVITNCVIKNTKPKEAIPVRLVTEDGEKFYRAGNVYVSGGSDSAVIAEVRKLVGFEIPPYDFISLTYVASGNGTGEIETVTYKKGGAAVARLTLTYNAQNEIDTVEKA